MEKCNRAMRAYNGVKGAQGVVLGPYPLLFSTFDLESVASARREQKQFRPRSRFSSSFVFISTIYPFEHGVVYIVQPHHHHHSHHHSRSAPTLDSSTSRQSGSLTAPLLYLPLRHPGRRRRRSLVEDGDLHASVGDESLDVGHQRWV